MRAVRTWDKPDHPHGRGENHRNRADGAEVNGPSPRAWGKLTIEASKLNPMRTIPTGVGKTN